MVLSYVVSDAVLLVHCRLRVSLYCLSVEVIGSSGHRSGRLSGFVFFTQLPLVFQGFHVAVRDLGWGGGFFGYIPEGGAPVFVPLKQIIKRGVKYK